MADTETARRTIGRRGEVDRSILVSFEADGLLHSYHATKGWRCCRVPVGVSLVVVGRTGRITFPRNIALHHARAVAKRERKANARLARAGLAPLPPKEP